MGYADSAAMRLPNFEGALLGPTNLQFWQARQAISIND
jgi:hypothetical protein